jgi:hypothetical protein
MRRIVVFLAELALLSANLSIALAQDATPGAMGPSKLSGLGLPVVTLTYANGALQVPADVQAGTSLVVFDNQGEVETGISLAQLPEGISLEEAMAILGPPPAPEGTPGAEEMASPEGDGGGGGEEGPPPPLFYEMTWAGGAFAPPGTKAEVVVYLTPGEWILAPDPESGVMPATMQVGGDAIAPVEVAADITAEVKNFHIILPDVIPAGDSVWTITNKGDQPHEMFIVKTQRRLTLEEADIILNLPEGELPPEGVPDPSQFEDIGGMAPISKDQTVSIELTLEPGSYVAVCFMPDKDTGMPHALKGMAVIFEVAAEGQTVDPPASPESQDETGTPTS